MTRISLYLAVLALIISLSNCAHKHEFTRRIPHGIGDGPLRPDIFCNEYRGGLVKLEDGKAYCASGSVLNVATGEVE